MAISVQCEHLATLENITHGFFTRKGGSSTGLYESLNCGYGSGDEISTVAANRGAIARALGAPDNGLCTAFQIHSPRTVTLTKAWAWDKAPEADALVTQTPGIAIGVLTADCVPVLFADAQNRVIGAAHAGWKGAHGGVLEATIAAMQACGSAVSDIRCAIGPAIEQASYEVGPEFAQRLIEEDESNGVFFMPSATAGHRMFDLKGYVCTRLEKAGITRINILAHDTYSDEDSFFSYRRATHKKQTVYGRQLSAIMLQP